MSIAEKIAANARYQEVLGWHPEAIALQQDNLDGEDLVYQIALYQKQFGMAPADCDGILGPKTYAAFLRNYRDTALARLRRASTPDERLTIASEEAVFQATIDWLSDVVDAKASTITAASREYIDETVRTPIGSNWTWESPYRGDGAIEWCGMFVARAYHATVKLALRQAFFPSTYRLDRFARYRDIDGTKNPRPTPSKSPISVLAVAERMIVELDEYSKPTDAVFPDGTSPRGGDILLVGGVNTGYGKHCTLVRSYQVGVSGLGYFETIEGNATGKGPKGDVRQGVIRAKRPVGLGAGMAPTTYFARRLIRLSPADLGL